MPQTNLLKTIIPLSIVCAVLVGYQYMGATWTAPTAAAPGNNAAAPINVGTSTQSEQVLQGTLAVDALAVFGDMIIVSEICNADRSTCATVEELLAGGGAPPPPPPPPSLINNQHTQAECTAAGGVVFNTGAVLMCQFNGGSCPATWTPYLNWTQTQSVSCQGSHADGSCRPHWSSNPTTGQHGFANMPRESVTAGNTVGENCNSSGVTTCYATITQIGCY